MIRYIIIIFSILFNINFIYSELNFNPLSISEQNKFLFNSIETIGKNQPIKTLFLGELKHEETFFRAYSFFPEVYIYSKNNNKLYIQNKTGLYCYSLNENRVDTIDIFSNIAKKDEYTLYRLPEVTFSPNFRYLIGKVPTSPSKSSIYLYDLENNSSEEIIQDVEIVPGAKAGLWSKDSNFFIYQKNGEIYYFSILDHKNKKQLNEEWRWIGNVNLSNALWTENNYLIWIEKNLIYLTDPNQFFSRSIYRSYLRQGEIIGKLPFDIEPAFDNFVFNEKSQMFLIAKGGNSIYYYSLSDEIKQSPYLRIDDNSRYSYSKLLSNGEGVISVDILSQGKKSKKIFLIKNLNNEFRINEFVKKEFEKSEIFSFSVSDDEKEIVINSSLGAYCYNFDSEQLLWKSDKEPIKSSVNIGFNQWIIGGFWTTYRVNNTIKNIKPIFASSIDDAGFINKENEIGVVCNNTNYYLDLDKKTITQSYTSKFNLNKDVKNNYYRLLSRDINKGFYKQSIYLKDLYSGKQIDVTGLPNLRYKLFQPEIKLTDSYYYSPDKKKYELAIVFNCIKTAEGIFPILSSLANYKIPVNFFINGNFMDINKSIIKTISDFDIEVSNMFQYYVNLTDSNFLIDKNFIRQGLSTNEEKYYKLTGKNFAPYWHTPYYTFNESIIKYGVESGYSFVSYNLDSYDWVGKNNKELFQNYYMTNSELIERVLLEAKPGQIIIMSTGKNYTDRDQWLFNDFDLLISELLRSGYSFSFISDHQKKYRY